MKAKDLRAKSVDELVSLRNRITRIIATKQRQMQEARQRVFSIAKRCGVSLRELGLRASRGPDKAPRKARRVDKLVEAHVRKHKAKFINPKDTSKTWNGRGRPPLWFKAMKVNGAASHATH